MDSMHCCKRVDCCFHVAEKFGFDCQRCGIDPEGTMKASMRGTGKRLYLCAACFWESRVDPAMEWCPCAENVKLRQVHNELRALKRRRQ